MFNAIEGMPKKAPMPAYFMQPMWDSALDGTIFFKRFAVWERGVRLALIHAKHLLCILITANRSACQDQTSRHSCNQIPFARGKLCSQSY